MTTNPEPAGSKDGQLVKIDLGYEGYPAWAVAWRQEGSPDTVLAAALAEVEADDLVAAFGSAARDAEARIRELEDAMLDLFSFNYRRKAQEYMKKHGLVRRTMNPRVSSSPSTGEKASTEVKE